MAATLNIKGTLSSFDREKSLNVFLIILVYCTQPPVVANARHNSPAEQETFELDTELQYQCFPGYISSGFARSKCFYFNGTTRWFGPDLKCKRKLK